ncbi:hypothetical protein BGX38DRAFT_1273315 [Terfezia claveryi]|nr:hypothetical protein BGX38DRAFT_1273315 [Terfezia claveryi]
MPRVKTSASSGNVKTSAPSGNDGLSGRRGSVSTREGGSMGHHTPFKFDEENTAADYFEGGGKGRLHRCQIMESIWCISRDVRREEEEEEKEKGGTDAEDGATGNRACWAAEKGHEVVVQLLARTTATLTGNDKIPPRIS